MKENIRKLLLITLGIMLIMTFIKALMILGIIIILLQANKKNNKIENNKNEELEIIDSEEHNFIRLQKELAQEKINEKEKVMKATDVRQFQGRNDVTVDEVAEYMLNKSQFIGLVKRGYQLERISQVCNITKQDIKEIEHQIWGKAKVNEDKEGQKERDWWIQNAQKEIPYESPWEQIRNQLLEESKTEKDKEIINQIWSIEKVRELEKQNNWNDKQQKFIHYEKWLKEKGYINE